MVTKKEDVYKKALQGNRIPILTLDNKWHRLFNMMEPDRELKRLEEKLNALLKLQGKMNTESKSIKKIKKKLTFYSPKPSLARGTRQVSGFMSTKMMSGPIRLMQFQGMM